MLDGLRERGVRATFFLQGQCIEGNEESVRQMQADGHLIGNHTFSHVQLTKLSPEAAKEEVVQTSSAIYNITGVYTSFVRPPFGEWPKGLEFKVTMIPVLWTVDSKDWYTQNTPVIVKEVLNAVEPGDIILMHDAYETSVESAMQIVDALKKEGYEFVTAVSYTHLYSHNLASLTVKKFDYNTSILILVFVVLGGIGNIRGSIIATIILYLLPELLRFLQDYRMLIYAICLLYTSRCV